jgi:hypothetical protein
MKDAMSEIDLEELRSELDDFAQPEKAGGVSAKEQRIVASFEEIERFVEERGRLPQHGENGDIFERLYAVRLDRLRASPECREILKGRDSRGLLGSDTDGGGAEGVADGTVVYGATTIAEAELSDDELRSALEGDRADDGSDIFDLKNVRTRDEIRAAEEVAKRNPCNDFEAFRPVFEKVQHELETGERQTLKYKDNADVKNGDLFILDGQKVLVAEVGEVFVSHYGRPDSRLRVIFDNGTESDLLVRSLQRALNKDQASRRITEPDHGPLFSGEADNNDLPSGYIYVLRSKSEHPFVAQNRTVLHKIGVTGGEVKARIANAKKDPTYLLAEVEIVETWKLANINRVRLEALLHRFFAPARLDIELKDRFGAGVEPQEWFLVPLTAIRDAVEHIKAGTISGYKYDPSSARVVARDDK